MAYSSDYRNKPRRYIQFNDLVFTGTKSIEEQSESVAFRLNSTPRSFTHGSFVANQGHESIVDNNTISFRLALKTNTWSDENIRVHYDFIIRQLTMPGKLWAVSAGHQLIWCNAYLKSMEHRKNWVITDEGYLIFQVEFDNPDGVWYKANEHKTFFDRFDLCDFTQMKADCLKARCCDDGQLCLTCECCEDNCGEMLDFCSADAGLDFEAEFFDQCDSKWRVVYNCQKARLEGKRIQDLYAHTICDMCLNGSLAGEFTSDTVLDSRKWNVAIFGKFKDPIITINDKDVQVKGEYNGVLTVDYRGEVRYATSWECLEYNYKRVPIDLIGFCSGGFRIRQGKNKASVYGVQSSSACLYIDYERVTL